MFRSSLAAIALIACLAACEAEGTDEPTTPVATATAGETTVGPASPPLEAENSPELSTSEPDDSDCGADKLGRWLNVFPSAEVKAEIAATVGRRAIRYIGPGDAVTLDFSPSRLNVEQGKDGRIKLFRCG